MIRLTMTEEQAKIVSLACEFYARVRMGQFNEIVWHTLDIKIPGGEYCERRERAEQLLLDVRKQIYPDLHGAGHSYGIGKFDDADLAFDVHQVIRREMGDERPPFSYHELPTCERVELSSSTTTAKSCKNATTAKSCKNCKHKMYIADHGMGDVDPYCKIHRKYLFNIGDVCTEWENREIPF